MINEKTNKDDNQAVLICKGITKSFKDNKDLLEVLTDVNLTVKSGDRIAITGTSGSGKTTLLQIMGGLDEPTSGVILINGQLLNKTSEKQKSFIRNQYLGFVYQFHHLLAEFSAERKCSNATFNSRYKERTSHGRGAFAFKASWS